MRSNSGVTRHIWSKSIILALAVLLTACGSPSETEESAASTSEPATSTEAASEDGGNEPLQPVRLILDWSWSPHHAPFILAQEEGYYEEAGLDVLIEQGRGSVTSATQIGHGDFDIAHINVTNVAQAIDKAVPIRTVAIYQPNTPTALVGIEGKVDVSDVASLLNYKIGSTPGGSDGLALSVLVETQGLDAADLDVVSLEGRTKLPALLSGQIELLSGDGHAFDAAVREEGQTPVVYPISDFGVRLFGFGFAANSQFAEDNPELVSKFLEATRRAFIEVAEDTEAACELMQEVVELTGSLEYCSRYISNLADLSTSPSDDSWGHQDEDAWQEVLSGLEAVGQITFGQPVSEFYTNDHLPSS